MLRFSIDHPNLASLKLIYFLLSSMIDQSILQMKLLPFIDHELQHSTWTYDNKIARITHETIIKFLGFAIKYDLHIHFLKFWLVRCYQILPILLQNCYFSFSLLFLCFSHLIFINVTFVGLQKDNDIDSSI